VNDESRMTNDELIESGRKATNGRPKTSGGRLSPSVAFAKTSGFARRRQVSHPLGPGAHSLVQKWKLGAEREPGVPGFRAGKRGCAQCERGRTHASRVARRGRVKFSKSGQQSHLAEEKPHTPTAEDRPQRGFWTADLYRYRSIRAGGQIQRLFLATLKKLRAECGERREQLRPPSWRG
jgi:hypothetical protein